MTLRDRYSAGFRALGYESVPSRSGKYVVFSAGQGFYFLGRSGAVRYCRTNSATRSVPVRESVKQKILAAANEEA